MKKINFIFVGLMVMLMASCAVRKPSNSSMADLVGKKWQLVELNGKPVAAKVNGKMPFLKLEEKSGRYGASGGCNGIGGEYTLEKNNGIKFSRGISTMMACMDMSIEYGLRTLFDEAVTYDVNGSEMVLKGKNNDILAKFAMVVDQTDKLVGTWELDYILEPETTFDVLYPERKPTITFDVAEKKVNGNSSCNSFSGSVNIDGHTISFGPMASTKMACPGNGEQVFLKNLERVTSFDVQDSTLTMIMDDMVVMRWQKK
ncbi:META domain-containing protein [Sphingobacterium chuzhouense]|uniref:META domain-containing protein n=1 Tax=Sphingobacterium chuzhouense TaxID=1742264 RepID=A0ABR7XPM0_9SPHI|nr:META domain-containing protein [Sphingobacterium chuzhouense]MBD1420227.1 META domain-containing protein [Sphingobacterium chuzhouense]